MNVNGKVKWTLGRKQDEIELLIFDQEEKMLSIIPFKEILKLYKEFKK